MHPRRRRRWFPVVAVVAAFVVVGAVLVGIVLFGRGGGASPSSSGTPGTGGTNNTGIPGGPGGSGGTPLGTALALGAPSEAATGTGHWYNFSVTSAASGLAMNDLAFQVSVRSTGSIVSPSGGWTMTVLGTTGTPVATYAFASDSWTTVGTAGITSSQEFSFYSGTVALSGQGDVLKSIGVGTYSGSSSVDIP